jgi:nitrite reductase/ring-hydroxylating ferredoxin subunit
LQEHTVTCPWHGWQFDCRTGQSTSAPGKAVSNYAVQVEGDDVMVEVG